MKQDNQGTIVNFYRDVPLSKPVNKVVIRARSVTGLETTEEREIRFKASETKVWAAVIGVGSYQRVPKLDYSVADAESVYKYLVTDLGVPQSQVVKLIDANATTPGILTALGTWLQKRAGKDDQVIIYFAGHGAPETVKQSLDGDGLEKYLLPVESDPDNLFGSAVAMRVIAEIFERLQAKQVIFIVDACYSGAAGGRTLRSRTRASISDRYLERLSASGPGRVILTASSANEVSQERPDLGHGVFTYYLLRGLRRAADQDDDGLVTVDEIYNYVSKQVPEATGQAQHPVRKGEVEGTVILGRTRRN